MNKHGLITMSAADSMSAGGVIFDGEAHLFIGLL